MRIPKSGSFYFAFLLFVFISILIAIAIQYNKNAALVPMVIGIPTALLIVAEMVREQNPVFAKFLETGIFQAKRAKSKPGESLADPRQNFHKELMAILIVIGFMLLVLAVGFLIAIPSFSFLYMLVFAHESLKNAILAALFTWLFIYLIFCTLMDIRFPWSFII